MIESLSSPSTDPLVIWLNGGPGCSSLIGAFQENGPFIIDDGQNVIKPNTAAWNVRANLLYLESPAHVGFSIGGANDFNFTDLSAAEDLFAAVQSFFGKFPEYLPNPLWITGESYAGVYGPWLAYNLHTWNQAAEIYNQTTYNFKGFAIGNGITDWTVDAEPSTYETFYEMDLIPKSLYDQFAANDCKFNVGNPYNTSEACKALQTTVSSLIAGLDIYDLYRTTYGVNSSVPNTGAAISAYLGRADVRASLHIPLQVQAWERCTSNPLFHYPFSREATLWIYTILKPYGYQLMHYSGDTDGKVPTLGTRRWVAELGWPVTQEWQPWSTDG